MSGHPCRKVATHSPLSTLNGLHNSHLFLIVRDHFDPFEVDAKFKAVLGKVI
jgi:hypothetical protein